MRGNFAAKPKRTPQMDRWLCRIPITIDAQSVGRYRNT